MFNFTKKSINNMFNKTKQYQHDEHRIRQRFQVCLRLPTSTETAVLKVLADILLELDSGDLAMLTLLDLSAAFDSVDHDTLLTR